MALMVYGIPTCNSCKKALRWLNEHNEEYTWINTRDVPPTVATITGWVNDIGNKPLRNTSGGSYRALGDEKKSWSDDQWIQAFAEDAMLLKRPLFVRDGTALFTGFRGSDQEIEAKLKG